MASDRDTVIHANFEIRAPGLHGPSPVSGTQLQPEYMIKQSHHVIEVNRGPDDRVVRNSAHSHIHKNLDQNILDEWYEEWQLVCKCLQT